MLISCRGLDFTPNDAENFKEDAPLIVVLHGLTGGMLQDSDLTFDTYTGRRFS